MSCPVNYFLWFYPLLPCPGHTLYLLSVLAFEVVIPSSCFSYQDHVKVNAIFSERLSLTTQSRMLPLIECYITGCLLAFWIWSLVIFSFGLYWLVLVGFHFLYSRVQVPEAQALNVPSSSYYSQNPEPFISSVGLCTYLLNESMSHINLYQKQLLLLLKKSDSHF